MFEKIHHFELSFNYFLQQFRTPFVDSILKFLNFFDTETFMFLLIPIIWGFYGKRWGVRILYLVIISAILNFCFKLLFEQPRPTHIDPTLGIFQFKSFGFPSGGAQSTLILGGLAIYLSTTFLRKLFFIMYILIISFSRIGLGVHFATDVIGGWIIGFIILTLFLNYYEKIENWISKRNKLQLLLLCFLPFFLLILPKSLNNVLVLLGCNLGLFLMGEKSDATTGLTSAIFGLIGIFGLFYLGKPLLNHFIYFLLPLWLIVVLPCLNSFESQLRGYIRLNMMTKIKKGEE